MSNTNSNSFCVTVILLNTGANQKNITTTLIIYCSYKARMTSTNVNVGIEGRSSSRVLKPPGGGHSDIFGSTQGRMEVTNSRFSKQSQKSSISECFVYGNSPAANKQELISKTVKENGENANVDSSDNGLKNGSASEDENTRPAAGMPSVPRGRVPPGGFSSILW